MIKIVSTFAKHARVLFAQLKSPGSGKSDPLPSPEELIQTYRIHIVKVYRK